MTQEAHFFNYIHPQNEKRRFGEPPSFNHENKILLFSQKVFYRGGVNHRLFESVGSSFGGTLHFHHSGIGYATLSFQCCNNLLCHLLFVLNYLTSLCNVIFFKYGLYFISSSLSGVFFLFFVVMYLDIPGTPLAFCSVHSKITC